MVEPVADAEMEVELHLSPTDKGFIDCLGEPLASIAYALIGKDKDALAEAASRIAGFEIGLKEYALRLIVDVLQDRSKCSELGFFWRKGLDLCQHIVHFSEQDPLEDQRYEGLEVRKIPITVLEDILDSLPVDLCKEFWADFVVPAYGVLFSAGMWNPSPKNRPCWLPFLRLSNRFMTRLPPEEAATIMITLSRVYPMSEKSALRPWGSYNADNVTELETEEEFQSQQTDSLGKEGCLIDTDEDGSMPDYSFYGAFWNIQKDLNHPTGISVADFLVRLSVVFNALESRSHLLAPNPQPTTKYLTSSRILHKQLSDPDFRMHILVQFLIAAHHLSSQVPVMAQKLEDYQRRARSLLKAIETYGPKLLSILEYVLDRREKEWREWKQNKCLPNLEVPDAARMMQIPRKRARDLIEDATNSNEVFESIRTDGNLREVAQKMRKVVPTLETHLGEYVEALDPEAGIEAEYHPKNDSLFSWRALRLLSMDHLERISLVFHNGDFEPMVRQIYQENGSVIPGDCPLPMEEDFEEDGKADEPIDTDDQDRGTVEEEISVETDEGNQPGTPLEATRSKSIPGPEENREDPALPQILVSPEAEETAPPKDESPPDEHVLESGPDRMEVADKSSPIPENGKSDEAIVIEKEDVIGAKSEDSRGQKSGNVPDKENGRKSPGPPLRDPADTKLDSRENLSTKQVEPKLDEKNKNERKTPDRDTRPRPSIQDRPPRPYDGPPDNRRQRDDRQVRDWRENERRGDGGNERRGDGGFRGHMHRGTRDDRRASDRRGSARDDRKYRR